MSNSNDSTLVIIGCGAQKLSESAPACELYTSQHFCAKRRYAEGSGHRWMILSARYGLLRPEELIEPYDLNLGSCDDSYLWLWRRYVGQQWLALGFDGGVTVELHAGLPYRYHLRLAVGSITSHVKYTVPLLSLGIGQQLAWYKQRRAA